MGALGRNEFLCQHAHMLLLDDSLYLNDKTVSILDMPMKTDIEEELLYVSIDGINALSSPFWTS